MNYKELLYDKDKVLSFFPELAIIFNKYDELNARKKEITTGKYKKPYGNGLNKAIFINQLNYWLEINEKAGKNLKDGHYWVYNSYESWAENDFQYWSADTVKRIVSSLENIGVIISANYNKFKIDKTKWYRIDYKRLQEIIDTVKSNEEEKQNATKENADCGCDRADCPNGKGSMNKPIPEITPKNTDRDYGTENTDNSFSKEKDPNNSPQGECNSFSREKKDTHSSRQKKPLSEKELEQANYKMPYRASGIAYKLTENRDLSNNIFQFFEYFLDERKKYTGTWHIPLSDTTLAKVVVALIEDIKVDRGDYEDTYFSLVIDELGNKDYKEVVDKYFKTKFKNKVDYSIVHFTQENVLINIMNHCGRENWCMSGI